jgi:Domain of unknown function (DUF4132)
MALGSPPAILDLALQGGHSEAFRAALLANPAAVEALLAGEGNDPSSPWEAYWRKRHTLAALCSFPVNTETLPLLMKLALSNVKEQRETALAAFEAAGRSSVPRAVFIEALASGSKDTRVVALEWIAKLRITEATQALSDACKKEKVETLRASMVRVLVGFGVPIDSFLDRALLVKEAEKTLKKGMPEALAFVAINTLPAVHWKDGTRLDPRVLAAWLVSAHKSKSPIASPLIVAYAAELQEAEREALGRAIYERWSEADFAPRNLTSAQRERIQDYADHRKIPFEQAQYQPDFKMNTMGWGTADYSSIEQGALDQRGVLALAAALAPRFLAPECVRYVKLYRGLRIGQSRAMVHMLAGMETAAATQALVALSLRFRTASLRKEAEKMVNDLAARRGWTPDELADRTMPTAGLDEAGCLELAFVKPLAADDAPDPEAEREITRCFTAKLDPNLDLALFASGDGSLIPLAKLPEPRKEEDTKHAGEEKKRLAASKKELKALISAQRARLYAAMCSERVWTADAFAAVYLSHPVMKHVAARLLLQVTYADGPSQVCRPSGDGSYVDDVDSTIVIPGDSKVRLAHSAHLTPDEEARWGRHCSDYEVVPFFGQLGRKRFELNGLNTNETRIPSSHTINSFKLRGLATRLGFDRGPTGDGGHVYSYEQRLPSLGLSVVIAHSSVYLGDQNQDITLEGIEFVRAEQHAAMPLGTVPRVLLHEGWNVLLELTA